MQLLLEGNSILGSQVEYSSRKSCILSNFGDPRLGPRSGSQPRPLEVEFPSKNNRLVSTCDPRIEFPSSKSCIFGAPWSRIGDGPSRVPASAPQNQLFSQEKCNVDQYGFAKVAQNEDVYEGFSDFWSILRFDTFRGWGQAYMVY